ncbi:diphthine--ammonia ligase [Denticeps clupeoides]|uniref:Diphthine--ammonia ligase n=1 Tax=Denticeps clupeoides TaxID=299321 RepID=A0AAY4AQ51_9TELE|nr:diphthine--ammonia ligase [Denticeps clupeoides]
MKVVALISGGKDSCYNMMQCVAAGHSIVALANLRPSNKDELDSYMYQTVGHQAIELLAEAMGLPLYRRTIEGTSLDTGREYSQRQGDEVEDLYHLLKHVKEKEGVEAVSVGAILSDYQRVRVENVCARLRLQPLAYLWRRDQETLLSEIISCDLHALLIKVAAFGLDPEKHLGKSLSEMEPYLKQLSQKYGVHVCGEGGEYETFTTDCPLFKKRIVIDAMETVIHSADAFAPVGYLRFTQMHTENKGNGATEKPLPLGSCPCRISIDKMTEEAEYADKTEDIQEEFSSDSDLSCQWGHECIPGGSPQSSLGYEWITGITGSSRPANTDLGIRAQTERAFNTLQGELESRGRQMKHIVLVHLYVRDMAAFAEVNSVYATHFGSSPPARVCVEAPLPAGQLLLMDCLLHDWARPAEEGSFQQREALHVQSLSHWAPANIGPYSQAVRVDEAVFCAGQIALQPCSMQLVAGGAKLQTQLIFSHVKSVLEAVNCVLTPAHILQAHCYVTRPCHIPAAVAAWQRSLRDATDEDCFDKMKMESEPLVIAVVPTLPREAAVELHIVAVLDDPCERTFCKKTRVVSSASITCERLQSSCGRYASLSLAVQVPSCASDTPEAHAILGVVGTTFLESISIVDIRPLFCRAFFKHNHTLANELSAGLTECLKEAPGQEGPAVAFVPVLDLPDSRVLHLTCWCSV